MKSALLLFLLSAAISAALLLMADRAETATNDARADHYAETGVMFPGGSYDEGERP